HPLVRMQPGSCASADAMINMDIPSAARAAQRKMRDGKRDDGSEAIAAQKTTPGALPRLSFRTLAEALTQFEATLNRILDRHREERQSGSLFFLGIWSCVCGDGCRGPRRRARPRIAGRAMSGDSLSLLDAMDAAADLLRHAVPNYSPADDQL